MSGARRLRCARCLPRHAPQTSPLIAPPLALVFSLLLAACASTPRHNGFYREDGPPERTPENMQSTPDAVPRNEPLNAYANRPYVALGHNYVPVTSETPFRQRGIASWYGRQFQGNRTASGERYDMFAMTAAHPTLPIPCYARVTSLRDGRSVVVRINDRGPFYKDRIIDLSYAAATRLGLAGQGSGEVEVERILPSQTAHPASPAGAGYAGPARPPGQTPPTSPPPGPAPAPPADAGEAGATVAYSVAPMGGAAAATSLPPAPASPAGAGYAGQGAPSEPAADGARHWSVQLGAFTVPVNADALRDRLALLLGAPEAAGLPAPLRLPRVEREGGLSRVLIGAASDRAQALQWARLLEQFLSRPTTLFQH